MLELFCSIKTNLEINHPHQRDNRRYEFIKRQYFWFTKAVENNKVKFKSINKIDTI